MWACLVPMLMLDITLNLMEYCKTVLMYLELKMNFLCLSVLFFFHFLSVSEYFENIYLHFIKNSDTDNCLIKKKNFSGSCV